MDRNDLILKKLEKLDLIEIQVAKIDGIEREVAKIAGIEKEVAKIAGIENRLSGMELEVAKIGGMENMLGGLERQIDVLFEHVEENVATKQQMSEVRDRITSIESLMEPTAKEYERLDHEMSALRSRADRHEERTTKLERMIKSSG